MVIMDQMVDQIEKLLADLYNANGAQKESLADINRQLVCAQNSKEAWTFVWQLLHKSKSSQIQYFGASTLCIKITKHFAELDQNAQQELRHRLVECLISSLSSVEHKFVVSKLVQCLAVFILHSITTTWPTALADMVALFQPEKLPHLPPGRVIDTLLQLLSIMPDELTQIVPLEKCAKIAVRTELRNQAESVMYIMHKVLCEDNISDSITQICVQCFANWTVKLGVLVLTEQHSTVVDFMLSAICNENTCHQAIEALVTIYTHPLIEKQPKLVLQLIQRMTLGLEPLILKSTQEGNLDYCQELYYLFIKIGQTHSRLLLDTVVESIEHKSYILKLLHIILRCTATPGYFGHDETISDQSFNFWITFHDDIMASLSDSNNVYIDIFGEIYDSLIETLLIKAQYPPDEIYLLQWDDEDREKFRCFRQDIGDTLMYCFNATHRHSPVLLKTISTQFTKVLDQVRIDCQKMDTKSLLVSAAYLESTIFAVSSIADCMLQTEEIYLSQLFMTISTIQFDKVHMPRLLESILTLICNSSLYLGNAEVQYIVQLLPVIATALKTTDPPVVAAATMALKSVTPELNEHNMHQLAPNLVALCEEHLSYSTMEYKDKARLMFTLAAALSNLPLEVIMHTIDRILVPILAQTEKLLYINDEESQQQEVSKHLSGVLLMLANLFSELNIIKTDHNQESPKDHNVAQSIAGGLAISNTVTGGNQQPLYIIFEKVLPMFAVIASKYGQHDDIANNLCECVKKFVITVKEDVRPLLDNILQLLVHLFQASKSERIVKISRQIFMLFGKNVEYVAQLQEYFYTITQGTFTLFAYDFRENTSMVQAYYEECAKILKKGATSILVNPKMATCLSQLFNYAISGIMLPEKGTIHQCALFIIEFIIKSRDEHYCEQLHHVISENFELLLMQVFAVIGGTYGSPSFAIEYMTDILLTMIYKYSDNFSRSLKRIIDTDAFPTNRVSQDDKMAFAKTLITLRNNKRKLKDHLKEFSNKCRGTYVAAKNTS